MVTTAKDGLTMARKSIVSYAGLALGTDQGHGGAAPTPEAMPLPERRVERTGGARSKKPPPISCCISIRTPRRR